MPRLSKRARRDLATGELGKALERLDWADQINLLTEALAFYLTSEAYPRGFGIEILQSVVARLLEAANNAAWEDGFDAAKSEEEVFGEIKDQGQKRALDDLPDDATPH
jgi:hypothetical protein